MCCFRVFYARMNKIPVHVKSALGRRRRGLIENAVMSTLSETCSLHKGPANPISPATNSIPLLIELYGGAVSVYVQWAVGTCLNFQCTYMYVYY